MPRFQTIAMAWCVNYPRVSRGIIVIPLKGAAKYEDQSCNCVFSLLWLFALWSQIWHCSEITYSWPLDSRPGQHWWFSHDASPGLIGTRVVNILYLSLLSDLSPRCDLFIRPTVYPAIVIAAPMIEPPWTVSSNDLCVVLATVTFILQK